MCIYYHLLRHSTVPSIVFDTTHTPHISFFFFNDTATTEIYTLSLHDALPISPATTRSKKSAKRATAACPLTPRQIGRAHVELQSQSNLVCRLLLEKKKKKKQEKQKQEYRQTKKHTQIA